MVLITKIISIFTVAVALTVPAPVYALANNNQDGGNRVLNEAERKAESTTESARDTARSAVNKTTEVVQETQQSKEEQVAARKAELQAQREAKMASRKAKLEGRKLALCQNRQDKINKSLEQSAKVSQTHLENVQRFEESVTSFAKKKSISSETYLAMLDEVDKKEILAIAAVDSFSTQDFDCEAVDATQPAVSIKEVRQSKREAMAAYRDSVIQLIQLVKQEFAASSNDTKETE